MQSRLPTILGSAPFAMVAAIRCRRFTVILSIKNKSSASLISSSLISRKNQGACRVQIIFSRKNNMHYARTR